MSNSAKQEALYQTRASLLAQLAKVEVEIAKGHEMADEYGADVIVVKNLETIMDDLLDEAFNLLNVE